MDTPRARIMAAARELFYWQGIQATGVEELAEKAAVSKRTLYKVFGSKDQVVTTYLAEMQAADIGSVANLARTDLTPRERLLALFDAPAQPERAPLFRGCPQHNAVVELAGPDHPAHELVHRNKLATLARITDTAREAGFADPEAVARRLFLLLEGAMALATSLDDVSAFGQAREIAEGLLGAA
ncbi:AcrR family transcriptional regulator [Crossiella equi]|uniref:AcrR family transcriptional regulator n=1 Tax=Crossiella equi TaxID=130796 RepID=A0ABS5A4P7_9PSEU|nr:TetR/AcrR family transcriptional regulator [Crossiella equi]MBP2471559.1 AcrR family transcriptional regulator [Crossiella equi]